jgi:ribonuclease VapC
VRQAGYVLDASVVLAITFGELTAAEAERWMADACISAVNLSEVVAKLSERGSSAEEISNGIAEFNLDVRPFDDVQAEKAGLLRLETRRFGLSLGDRACLALAAALERTAVTTDRTWAELNVGIAIEVVR